MNVFKRLPLQPNDGKALFIRVKNKTYARYPVRTHVITDEDSIVELCEKYAWHFMEPDDILFISEKIVAITQGRAFHIDEIVPSGIAKFLSRYVHKSRHGIGLGSPWTMHLAIREAGLLRILMAAFFSALTRAMGLRGVFYIIAGNKINAIDGPCANTIPPFNLYAKLPPSKPDLVAASISKKIKRDVVIIDANDLGVAVLGKSNRKIPDSVYKEIFRDNPLGQSKQQTPFCIVRQLRQCL